MRAKSIILIIVAVAMAGTTALLLRSWLAAQRAAMAPRPVASAPAQRGPEVLVAKVDLVAGQFVRPEHLRWQAWPEGSLAPAYVLQGRRPLEDFVGAVVRFPIAAGEPVTEGRVVVPGNSGFLAAVLQPGMRAVSVAVNPTSGISGFVFPGDRVDLILTHNLPRDAGDQGTRRGAATILDDLRVLALDQRIESQPGQALVARTATLEVTPRQGQIIAVAAEVGRISLSLRSLAREEQASPDGESRPAPEPGAKPAQSVAAGPGTIAAEQPSYVLDSDATPLLPPPFVNREIPSVTVFRGRGVQRVRPTEARRRGEVDEAQSESPNQGEQSQ